MNRPQIRLGVRMDEDPEYAQLKDDQGKFKVPEKADFRAERIKGNLQQGVDILFSMGPPKKPPPQPPTLGDKKSSVVGAGEKSNRQTAATTQKAQDDKKALDRKLTGKQEAPKVEVIKETTSTILSFGQQTFNRPVYVRKLKKIAENFQYATINQQNHKYYDVGRPFECQKSRFQTLSKSVGSAGYFQDEEFPTTAISVGRTFKKQQISWKKAEEFCNKSAFGKYVQPNDFQAGRVSCPSFLSVLSCLAQRERNIKRIIENQSYNANGFYYVRLNINGVWRYIAVDDFLPMIDQENGGVLSFRDSESQISISIIEKAYAKVYNGYSVFSRGCKPEDYLRDLTGSKVVRYELNDKDLAARIKQSLEQSWTIIAVPNSKIEELGLNSKYNLGVIGYGSKGFELRNSWGTFVEKSKLNLSKEGLFELSAQDGSKYFDYILVAQTDDSYLSTTIQSRHHSGFYSSYGFRSKENGDVVISVSQWDSRLYPAESKSGYSPMRLIVERRKSESVFQYVEGAFTNAKRNTDLVCSFTPGEYTVHCIGSWSNGRAHDYTITVFGSHFVKFHRNKTQSFPNLISPALQKLNLEEGKRAAKGYVQQYILYHEPTNLVLLTNLNVSGKPYDYTQDLSKVAFNTLNLVNGPNAETSYEAKLQAEIAEEKENYNADRRWNIHLEAKEAYTWVLSTSEDYNANNFRNWGFK